MTNSSERESSNGEASKLKPSRRPLKRFDCCVVGCTSKTYGIGMCIDHYQLYQRGLGHEEVDSMTDQTDDARQGFDESVEEAWDKASKQWRYDNTYPDPANLKWQERMKRSGIKAVMDLLLADPRFYLYIAEEHKAELIEKWTEEADDRDCFFMTKDDNYVHQHMNCCLDYTQKVFVLKDDSSTSQ